MKIVEGGTSHRRRACRTGFREGSPSALRVLDRASDLCGAKQKPCWKRLGDFGYGYKDPDASSSGVKKLVGKSSERNGKLVVQAGNNTKKGQESMPTGLAAALDGIGAVLALGARRGAVLGSRGFATLRSCHVPRAPAPRSSQRIRCECRSPHLPPLRKPSWHRAAPLLRPGSSLGDRLLAGREEGPGPLAGDMRGRTQW